MEISNVCDINMDFSEIDRNIEIIVLICVINIKCILEEELFLEEIRV